jgi:hypothetical protein
VVIDTEDTDAVGVAHLRRSLLSTRSPASIFGGYHPARHSGGPGSLRASPARIKPPLAIPLSAKALLRF